MPPDDPSAIASARLVDRQSVIGHDQLTKIRLSVGRAFAAVAAGQR
jgi:hypothetical protein